MFSIKQIVLLSLATIASYAAPMLGQQGTCLSAENAQSVATKYGELISAYSDAAADAILSWNFTDYSGGVNALINTCPVRFLLPNLDNRLTQLQQGEAAKTLPLLAPTFTSRELFKIGQGQQPLINFEQLGLWYSCDSVTIRWKSTNTAPGNDVKPIVGLIVMETIRSPAGSVNPFLIDTVYSEFDSGSWLQNLAAAGICGPSASVAGAPALDSAPVAMPAVSIPAFSTPSVAAVAPYNGTKVSHSPTASHFRA